MDKKVLFVIASQGFRDEEYFTPREILETAGAEVKVASDKIGNAMGADGGEVKIDFLISEVNPADYDAVVFIGGPGCLANLDNEDSYKLIRETVKENKLLASICISPVILAKAGVLSGKKATVWTSAMDKGGAKTIEQNGAIYQDGPAVIDGKIVTANGPGAAQSFGITILKKLTGNNNGGSIN